jgi:anion-transporting  ArsA/GET3 family ATPase
MALADLLKEKSILVVCGSGGVGKTTISASLALLAAMEGRKVLVCTIDPAKRLADSLGLKELGNKETRIPDLVFAQAGLAPKGELWGMMLDSKTTFDDLICRIAPDEAVRNRVLNNPFYQNITTALAGSQEFSATEKLFELACRKDYDLIVLDTPPTRHALDFLDAPNRLTSFLEAKVIAWFLGPYLKAGKLGFRFLNSGAAMAFRVLEKVTGYQTLADIADFFLVFEGLYEGFAARAAKVRQLMSDPATAFVLVTSPQSPSLLEASFFLDRLLEEKMPLGEVVFNRVYTAPTELSSEDVQALGIQTTQKLPAHKTAIDALCANLRLAILLAEADKRSIRRFLEQSCQPIESVRVPFMRTDIHDMAGLHTVCCHLAG